MSAMRLGHTKPRCVAVAVAGAVLAAAASGAAGDVITVPLPGLVDHYGDPRTVPLDLGTSFLSIDEVRVGVSGRATPGTNSEDGDLGAGLVWLWMTIEIRPSSGPGYPWRASILPYDHDPAPVNAAGWHFLLDGHAEISVSLLPLVVYSDSTISGSPSTDVDQGYLGSAMQDTPSIDVDQAYLVVEGVIPEPATLTLLALGGLTLMRRRRR